MVLVDGRMVWVQVAHILRYKILKGIKDIILLGASWRQGGLGTDGSHRSTPCQGGWVLAGGGRKAPPLLSDLENVKKIKAVKNSLFFILCTTNCFNWEMYQTFVFNVCHAFLKHYSRLLNTTNQRRKRSRDCGSLSYRNIISDFSISAHKKLEHEGQTRNTQTTWFFCHQGNDDDYQADVHHHHADHGSSATLAM